MATQPVNLHVSASALGPVRLKERVEHKYFFLPQKAGLALGLLRRNCRYDHDFPQEQINSLYFDTWDLDQHERSSSGEFAKDKVRIRWYGTDWESGDGVTGVWVELKSRRGFASTKQRASFEVPTARLQVSALTRGILSPDSLARAMADFGFFPRGILRPVMAISYWRHRFDEPFSGFRVALDSSIRSTMIRGGAGHGESALELPGIVVEVKGPSFGLPFALQPLGDLGASWTRYSKYSSSIEAHEAQRGSVSRLWPSGTMAVGPGSPVRLEPWRHSLYPDN